MSVEIKGLILAHAFKKLKSNGITLRVVELDGHVREFPHSRDKENNRINVKVELGRVTRCWIG
jgi:hypothetical protein